MSMRALVLRGGKVTLQDRAIPCAGPDDVVIRTTAVSMCSADVATSIGAFGSIDDIVLGHEGVGVVHELGANVSGFTIGERVATASTTPCGRCSNCQRGFAGHCGGSIWGGYQYGRTRDGSLAEYFVVPDANLNLAKIPDSVSDASALCVTDTLLSGTSGPEAANIPFGGTVAVFGQGHIGLAATMGARALGAGLVITVRARPGGEDLARKMGADLSLNLVDHDIEAEIIRLTDGHGVDCAIEASGNVTSFPQAVAVTRLGGVINVLSSFAGDPTASLPIPLASWGWGVGDKTILSVFQRPGSERLQRLLRLIETARIDPTPLLTRRYEFDQVEQAFIDLAHRLPGHVKPLITLST